MMHSADYYIEKLNMEPHIEGGYFKEHIIGTSVLGDFGGTDGKAYSGSERALWNTIYFLLKKGQVSSFHRLSSDEMWYFHDGSPLTVFEISSDGELVIHRLGLDLDKGQEPHVLIPAGSVFGAVLEDAAEEESFCLVSCMCSPCFRYEEFKILSADELRELFPQQPECIWKLTDL